LQYSIIKIETVRANPDFRYEAEFFSPKYLHNDRQLKNCATISLTEIATFHNGAAYDSSELNSQGDLWVAKIGDVTNKRDYISWDKVSLYHFAKLKACYLEHKDILMTLTGDPPDVGKVDLVFSPPIKKLSWNQRVARIRLKNNDSICESLYLFAALSSKYCRDHIERWAKGIRQRNVGNPAVLSMPIPVFSPSFQKTIAYAVDYSFLLLQQSRKNFTQAQTLLLSELGLLDWQPKHALSFVRNYSDNQQAGRIDADYFQPKYDEIVKAIKAYKGGWDTLSNLLNIKDKNFSPVDNKEYRYIELANIGGNGEVTGHTIAEGQELPTRARRKVRKNDVIVSSIEGSLSSIALISEELDSALCSTGFYVVGSDKINSETLLVLLKSPVGQEQLKKGCSGTILTAINKDELGKVILPVVDKRIQSKIQQKVSESFNLRKQSKHLLECAKKAVEMAIEKNEKTAINWIKQKEEKLKI